jgi:hypothetical protein
MAAMFQATLICSDQDCAAEVEAWAEPEELDLLLCADCGCLLQVIALAEAEPPAVVHLPRPIRLPRAA